MTTDEWRVRGLDLILSCDDDNLSQNEALHLQAVECFRHAGDVELTRRAQLSFELNIMKSRFLLSEKINLSTESEIAQLMCKFLESSLPLENLIHFGRKLAAKISCNSKYFRRDIVDIMSELCLG